MSAGGAEESCIMDKKYTRQSSVPPKAGDNKQKDSGNGNHRLPRQGRHKDNGNRPFDNQYSAGGRRPQSSKTRFVDKRPQPRGVRNGGGRDTVTQEERTGPEYGSVQSWGPKKNNLSHLLNFHFEPRDFQGGRGGGGGGTRGPYRSKGRHNWSRGTRFNKEHFLQANFQFVVKDSGDYSSHSVNPDALVDWELIEQIRIYSPDEIACPICLYPPRAAKITRCGHIYCCSCILHYLSLGDKAWRRCPICYDAVLQKDLKSVEIIPTHNYAVGDTISLKLMKRDKGSTQAMPIGQWTDREGKLYSLSDNVDTQYAKLLVVSSDEVLKILGEEKRQIEQQLHEEEAESLEGSYIKAALDMLKEREESLTMTQIAKEEIAEQLQELQIQETKEITTRLMEKAQKTVVYSSAFSDEEEERDEEAGPLEDDSETSPDTQPPGAEGEEDGKLEREDLVSSLGGLDDEDAFSAGPPRLVDTKRSISESSSSSSIAPSSFDESCLECVDNDTPSCPDSDETQTVVGESPPATAAVEENLARSRNASENSLSGVAKKNDNFCYFFQAEDGQNVFLHSVNAQCLIKEYGSLEHCPPTISAKIVEMQATTMNEDLRRRLKYLAHVPVTCEFQVAELNLRPPLVSAETLKLFSDKIERNRRQRQKKQREEKRFSRRIQEEEDRKMGIDPSAVFVQSEAFSLHQQQSSLANGLDNTDAVVAASPPVTADPDSLAASPHSSSGSDDGGQQSSMSFAQMLRAGKAKPQEAWPKASTGAQSAGEAPTGRNRTVSEDGDCENEEATFVPGYKDSFGVAIQQALDKYQGSDVTVGVEGVAKPSTTPSKKKKKGKTLLFTTTMNRAK